LLTCDTRAAQFKAKFHYTGPTGPDRTLSETRTDPTEFLGDPGRKKSPVGSGRARVVEISLYWLLTCDTGAAANTRTQQSASLIAAAAGADAAATLALNSLRDGATLRFRPHQWRLAAATRWTIKPVRWLECPAEQSGHYTVVRFPRLLSVGPFWLSSAGCI